MKYIIYNVKDNLGAIPIKVEGVACYDTKTGNTTIYKEGCE